jgi:hypothetical protein
MDFCDKTVVRKAIEGKRVALVGSAPSVLNNPVGLIDSFDVVVRVNNYKIIKPNTGVRTDIFYSFFGNSIRKSNQDLITDGVTLCMCKCPNTKFMDSLWHEQKGKHGGVDFRYIYEARKDFWFCDTYVPTLEEFMTQFNLLNRHVPTSGFSALLDVLSYDPASLYMTGYDFFTSGVHNVDEPWRKINNTDPIGHAPEFERKWFIKNHSKYPIELDEKLKSIIRRYR